MLVFLGFLVLVPFMAPVRAQTPDYVGVEVGEYYMWATSVYYGTPWEQWETDNMTDNLDTMFWHTYYDNQNLTNFHDSWQTAGAAPQAGNPVTIESIAAENTTTGITTISGEGGYLVLQYPGLGYDLLWDQTWDIANDTANFAAVTGYGVQMTTPGWLMYTYVFAPKNVNWTEYVELANVYWATQTVYSVYCTVSEITDGFRMRWEPYGFWTNTENLTIDTTYNDGGYLETYSFEYGDQTLIDVVLAEMDDGVPLITASPSDSSVENDYTGVTLDWTATDDNPNTYRVYQNGTAQGTPGFWASGTDISYAVDDGLAAGDYNFTIVITDDYGNSVTDMVILTVEAAPPAPAIPGYDLFSIIGIFAITTIGLVVMTKKKQR